VQCMVSLLISTWGDYRQWDSVKYNFGGNWFPESTRNTLPVILNYASPKPEKVILIVLDTVIKNRVPSYQDLRGSVEKYYRDFLSSLNINVPVEIIIAPGVGKFKLDDGGIVEFQGFISDFPAYVTFEILRRFLQVDGNDITVHLDLTHGINFMPSLTYAAINEALGCLAITKNVQLKVYNSEPYIRNLTTELNIHEIESRRILPHIKNEALPLEGRVLEPGIVWGREKAQVENALYTMRLDKNDVGEKGVNVKELNAFLSSLINGLPLAYYTFYPDVEKLEELLSKAVEIWLNHVKVYQMQMYVGKESTVGKMVVQRMVKFRNEFTKCAIIWATAKALNHKRVHEVKLRELENFCQKVFSNWMKLNCMISFDLEKVREDVQKCARMPNDWIKLSELTMERYIPPKSENVLIRNFLAHSGLERSLTYVRRQDGEIILSYDPNQRKREIILRACLKGLYREEVGKR
jgi:CRISPR-associated protein Csx1